MTCWGKRERASKRAANTSGTSIRWTAPRILRMAFRCFAFRWRWNARGSGSRLNGAAIHVSATANLGECLVATGFPSHKRHKNPNIYFYHQLTLRTHGVRRAGSAALDLCNVASGRFDGFWEFNLNPWDTAAGVLIVEEAGGKVTDFSGGAFQIASRETLASNGLVHDALLREFQEIFAGRGMEELASPVAYAKDRRV